MKNNVIVALDVEHMTAMQAALQRLPAEIAWFKVGLELFCADGPAVLRPLQQANKRIFLDLKLHDIPRTVEKAVASVARHGVQMLTIHTSGGRAMMEAAAKAARAASPTLKLLGVTVLTSLDQADLRELNVRATPAEQAILLAKQAISCGIDGVVCSVHEAAAIRREVGPDALIVTPGIRLPGDAVGDQKRVATPRDAHNAGATHIVVGRPILGASDPAAAYRAIMADFA